MVLVGGGPILVAEYLRKWFGEKLLDFASSKTTKDIHPVDANCIGGIRLAKTRLKQFA